MITIRLPATTEPVAAAAAASCSNLYVARRGVVVATAFRKSSHLHMLGVNDGPFFQEAPKILGARFGVQILNGTMGIERSRSLVTNVN